MLQQKIDALGNLSFLPKIASVFLAILICLTAVNQACFLSVQKKLLQTHEYDFTKTTPKTSLKISGSNPVFSSQDLQTVLNWRLFGQTAIDSTNIPLSVLSVKLTGILYSALEKDSKASISLNDAQEKIYGLSQTLPNGAMIESILPETVIIKYNGRLERLMIYDKNKIK